MDGSIVEREGYLPILSVTFDPRGLPPGAVDLEDLAQFLEGMQLALDGVVQYDLSIGDLAEANVRPRLTIVRTRVSSFACDIVINLFSGNTIIVDWHAVEALGATGLGVLLVMARDAIKDATTDFLKDGVHKVAVDAWAKSRRVSGQFMRSLEAAVSPKPDSEQLPPDLLIKMLAGLRKMGRVGAKQTYGRQGITVSSSDDPAKTAPFNSEAERHIESLYKAALASQEAIELIGTIEDPSRRRHRFVLDRPGQAKANKYVPCYYRREHEDLIRELYAKREYVKVKGHKQFRVHSNRSNPQMVVFVSSIEPTVPDTLWAPLAAPSTRSGFE